MRVIALPFAGGSSYSYGRLARESALPWTTLDPPGHGRRMGEALLPDMDAMADDLLGHVCAEASGQAYVLFGHSMGAYLCLALLERMAPGDLPDWVVLSGAAPPQLPAGRRLSRLPRDEMLAEAAALGGLPGEVLAHPELVEMIEPVLRAGFAATEGWRGRPRGPFRPPATIVRGAADALDLEPPQGWQACFTAVPAFEVKAGGHFFLFDDPAAFARIVCRRPHGLAPVRPKS